MPNLNNSFILNLQRINHFVTTFFHHFCLTFKLKNLLSNWKIYFEMGKFTLKRDNLLLKQFITLTHLNQLIQVFAEPHCERCNSLPKYQSQLSIEIEKSLEFSWSIKLICIRIPFSLFIWMSKVRGSPTVTGPEVRVPEVPKPLLISIWHCGGLIVKTTGLPVLTLVIHCLNCKMN